jgi:putative nucleotidyltransferase with HDIG domain
MAQGDNFAYGIEMLFISGLMRTISFDINKLYFGEYPHYRKHHPEGGLRNHIMGVLKHLDNQPAVVKLGGLFHDIGKPVAYKVEESGKYHYYMHDYIGLDVFDKVVERIHIPKDIANEVRYSIKNHMKMHSFLVMKDSKCYDIIDSPYWDSLYQVAYADDKSRLYLFDREFWNKVDAKVARIKLIVERKKVMSGILNGKLVMDTLEMTGGPKVGDVLKKAVAYVVNNNMDLTLDEDYQKIVKYIKTLK